MIKKLLSIVTGSALVLCLTLQVTQAMKRTIDEGEDTHKTLVTRQTNQTVENSLEHLWLPLEILLDIFVKRTHGPEDLINVAGTSTEWRDIIYEQKFGYCNLSSGFNEDGIPKFPYLIRLHLSDRDTITDNQINSFLHLKCLKLYGNESITDEGLKRLTGLIYLYHKNRDWDRKPQCSNGITSLTNLKRLSVKGYTQIKEEYFMGLTNLTHLKIEDFFNDTFKGYGIKDLTNLTYLSLSESEHFCCDSLIGLTKLITLRLKLINLRPKCEGSVFPELDDAIIKRFTNLTELQVLGHEHSITNNLADLTKLKKLSLYCGAYPEDFTFFGISELTALTDLHLTGGPDTLLTDNILSRLTSLTQLNLNYGSDDSAQKITGNGLRPLTKLEKWRLYNAVIRQCDCDRPCACKCDFLMNLKELDLDCSKLDVSHPFMFFTNLKTLHLRDRMGIEGIVSIAKELSNITTLSLSHALRDRFSYSEALELLPNLTHVNLNGEDGWQWSDVRNLTQLTNLLSLRDQILEECRKRVINHSSVNMTASIFDRYDSYRKAEKALLKIFQDFPDQVNYLDYQDLTTIADNINELRKEVASSWLNARLNVIKENAPRPNGT